MNKVDEFKKGYIYEIDSKLGVIDPIIIQFYETKGMDEKTVRWVGDGIMPVDLASVLSKKLEFDYNNAPSDKIKKAFLLVEELVDVLNG